MITLRIRSLVCSIALISMGLLTSCASTKVSTITKETDFKASEMQRILVIAVVKQDSTRTLLEDEFVRQLKKRGGEGVASHTLVSGDTKLDEAAWKKIVADNRFDSVIVSRLVNLEVIEKEVDPKYIQTNPYMGSYGYYSMGYSYMYQPSFSVRQETAAIETRVFQAAGDKQVWSAHSKTNIEQGRDPEAQVRDFVSLMLGRIYE